MWHKHKSTLTELNATSTDLGFPYTDSTDSDNYQLDTVSRLLLTLAERDREIEAKDQHIRYLMQQLCAYQCMACAGVDNDDFSLQEYHIDGMHA